MADTILGGDITVNYFDDNRRKQLRWTGSATGTRTMNEVYSAMATLLDESATGDDATCMTAETPVEYTIGIIDANDADPWYIQYECVQHLTGGALRTSGWTRTEGSATGVVVVAVTSNTIVPADVGFDITHTDLDSGTLLEVIEQGATDYLVIRPDSSAAANSFDSTSGTLTCNGNTATQAAASVTGEQIWANLYNVTPVDADAHAYMYQGLVSDGTRARISDINDSTQDWWTEGAFDRLIYIRDFTTNGSPIIDSGYITVFVRKGNTLYDSFEVLASTVSGGRLPVPLSASADANHTTGYRSITTTAVGTDDFTVGDEIEGATSGARGIITLIAGSSPTYTFHYYLIGDPQTDFQTAAETITNNDATGSATKDGNPPANQGPALATWFTSNSFPDIVHANTTFDIDDDGTAEGWGIDIDCLNNPLTEVYEWLQHVTRNGETGTDDTDGIEGEQYVGPTVYLNYGSSTVTGGTINEGDDVTQETTGATGIVVSHDTTLKQILLRDVRGTFATGSATDHTVTSNDNSGAVEMDSANATADNFNAVKSSPFGSLAGGRFFGARGVLLSNWVSGDENSFQLIDSSGVTRTRPIAITLSVSNLVGTDETTTTDDYVVSHRLTGAGGLINKTEYSAAGGEAIGDNTLTVDTAISADTPGKSAGGVLNIRDASNNNQHYRLRFNSWATSTFTLSNIVVAAADAGTTTTTIVEAGAFTNAKRGDLVLNITRSNAVSYVTEVTDANTIQISPAITGQTTGDNIEINAIPVAINTADDVYVSLIDEFATSTSASVSIVYISPIFYRVKVSNTRNATKIKRFVTDDTTSGTDRNVATIRNTDTIHT
jgi:hypothetical protein